MRQSSSATEYRLEKSFKQRLYIFTGVIVFTLLAFIAQLVNLQLIQGSENSLKAERFVRKSESLPASRGQIFDRNFLTPEISSPIISNTASLDAVVNSALLKNNPEKIKEYLTLFYKVLSIPPEYYAEEIAEPKFTKKVRSKQPIILLEGISKEQHERISVFDNVAKYIVFVPSPRRIYHMGPALAHISGYVGKPNREDLLSREIKSYQLVGKGGIEIQYDSILRGNDGFRIQKRNSEGNIEEERVVEHAKSGSNLILTIDKNIQIAAYRALKNIRGTVIAMKPATGEILAIASNPSFDPNILSGKNKQERLLHFNRVKKNKGFLNLAIQSKFPPASTFKTLVALAALESEHKIDYNPSISYPCNGRWVLKSSFAGFPDQEFLCWDKKGHGTNDLIHALEKSCSVYFYNLGYKLGSESILSYARLFGLDKKSNIDLPGEVVGFIPSNEWKKRTYGTKWFDGDTVNLSIGQGFISSTPMGMALFYAGIVNGGKIYEPYLVGEIRNPIDNSVIQRNIPKVLRDIPLKRSTIDAIKLGLRAVGKTGTASRILNLPNLPEIAGKTGTAQTKRRGTSGSNHAWFIGYAPFNGMPEEQVLVAVFLEYGIGGAAGAGPVAREVFKAAFPSGTFKRTEAPSNYRMDEEAPQEEAL
ncbi:MAG: penicillin-binding protein 2 [Leptospiraceae bacterium]|nr:penicillin-binding protein 2 [Leptospiraceae bacterium]